MVTASARDVDRVLAWSLGASAVSAVAGLAWGISSGSGAILFDGLFSALSLLTLWLALAGAVRDVLLIAASRRTRPVR